MAEVMSTEDKYVEHLHHEKSKYYVQGQVGAAHLYIGKLPINTGDALNPY